MRSVYQPFLFIKPTNSGTTHRTPTTRQRKISWRKKQLLIAWFICPVFAAVSPKCFVTGLRIKSHACERKSKTSENCGIQGEKGCRREKVRDTRGKVERVERRRCFSAEEAYVAGCRFAKQRTRRKKVEERVSGWFIESPGAVDCGGKRAGGGEGAFI